MHAAAPLGNSCLLTLHLLLPVLGTMEGLLSETTAPNSWSKCTLLIPPGVPIAAARSNVATAGQNMAEPQ